MLHSPLHTLESTQATGSESAFNGGMVESLEFRMLNISAVGNTVLTERVDVFNFAASSIELPVMGAFEVAGDKLSAWRDYFDLNQFMSQLPQG